MGPFCASARASMSRPQCALHLLMTLSHLPVPREGCSSSKLSASGIPSSPSDVHTIGGSCCLFWLGHPSLQICRQLRGSPRSHGAQTVLAVSRIRTEKRRFLAFFPHNVSVHSREHLILDSEVSYFHRLYIIISAQIHVMEIKHQGPRNNCTGLRVLSSKAKFQTILLRVTALHLCSVHCCFFLHG